MASDFDTAFGAAFWPNALSLWGETITHDPTGVTAAYAATLIFDDGVIVQQKGGKVAAAIKGPTTAFTTAPAERDVFTRGGVNYLCVEVDDDKAGGYICWVRSQG